MIVHLVALVLVGEERPHQDSASACAEAAFFGCCTLIHVQEFLIAVEVSLNC